MSPCSAVQGQEKFVTSEGALQSFGHGSWRVVCSEVPSMRHYDNGDDGSLSWQSLGFLPHALMYRFWEIFTHVHVLASSFEDEQGAEELLAQCTSEAEYLESGRRWRDSLMDWRTSVEPHLKRRRISALCQMSETMVAQGGVPSVEASSVYESVVQSSPKYALELAKRVVKRSAKSTNQATRAEKEAAELNRWSYELSVIIEEAGLPVTYQIAAMDNPEKGWRRIFGSRRAKTLRNRFRAWVRFRSWLVSAANKTWPRGIQDLVNYVEEGISFGCARTMPGELQAALVVLETAGRIAEPDQLSRDPTWLAHLQSWKSDLDGQKVSRGSAKPYSVAILIALELLVVDTDEQFYKRLIAWTMLMSVWACMRVDDVQCIRPESMRLSTRGFSVKLLRTKTTGPGKLHGQVHAFIQRDCTLTGNDWLAAGFSLWDGDDLMFPRDYLVPYPTANWASVRKKIMEPPALANHYRMVLASLGTPKREDGEWRSNPHMGLVPDEMVLFWTGHSARHVLPTISASIGCLKVDRDFLGRWAIGRSGSNSYLLTSRQIVERIQALVTKSLVTGEPQYDEDELLGDVKEFAESHHLVGHRIRRRHTVLPLRGQTKSCASWEEVESETEDLPEEQVENLKESALTMGTIDTGEQQQQDGRISYFVTVSRRTGFRRLHVVGYCHVQASRCQETVAVDNIQDAVFNAICMSCKKKLKSFSENAEVSGSDSDSSGSSTSTQVDTSEDEKVNEP